MSRFSKAEAERRGWVFVHQRDEHTLIESETQGRTQTVPATLRAEKYVSRPGVGTVLMQEEAPTLGLLLERIHAYEQHLDSLGQIDYPQPAEVDESAAPLNAAGLPIRTVITAEGTLTEEEWSSRGKQDAIYDGEKMIFTGPSVAAAEGQAASEAIAREAEDARTAEPDVGPTKQVIVDTSSRIDAPGQGAGGTLVVREDEDSEAAVAARRDAEKTEAEITKPLAPAPKPGEEDAVDVEITPASIADVRADAQEETAKEIRDDEGAAAADEPKAADEVREAGAEAEQKVADEAAEDPAPAATPAAQKLAAEKDIDLSEVEGTGKDGRITQPDVSKHAE